jgi:tetratricopeptide (TPR) repeat protein
MLLSAWAGPATVEHGRRLCHEVLERARGDPKGTASAMFMDAVLLAGLGEYDESARLVEKARGLLRDVGLVVWLAGPFAQMAGVAQLTCGDGAAAERELRAGYEKLEEIGEMAWQPTLVALLAEALYLQGRYDEAEDLTGISEKYAGSEDISSQVFWRAVRAPLLARRGASGEALEVARKARELADITDAPEIRARALLAHAEVLDVGGHRDRATALVREAVSLFEAKGNIAAAGRARARLVQTSVADATSPRV